MDYMVISCSLNPASRSRALAQSALEHLQAAGVDAELIDLSDHELPQCDGDACYDEPAARDLKTRLVPARGILIAAPVYNYDLSAAAKNLVELTGRDAWTGKVVGFLCAAGGHGSYMSVMGLANSLMLDFRTVIIPRFVYARKGQVEASEILDPVIEQRVKELSDELVRFTEALLPADKVAR